MDLKTVILGFLNDGPATGYELSKKMESSVGFYWHATHPQIYTTLKTLVTEQLAQYTVEHQEAGPTKKVYSITPRGQEILQHNLLRETFRAEIKMPLLVTMFFGGELGREFWLRTLESHLEIQQGFLALYREMKAALPEADPEQDLKEYLRLKTLDFGIGYEQFMIQWLETIIEDLSQ
jgi:DNA-binding PadR family transcriptional regulator